MDGDFGGKLRQILGDAEAMEKISAIASGLQNGSAPAEKPRPAEIQPVRDDRAALLSALRPLLREEKRKKLDALQTALAFATMIGSYKKQKTE